MPLMRYPQNGPLMFDPLVINDSVHLDRVLNTGHASSRAINASLKSPLVSSSSSDSPPQPTRRPKLSDGLNQATFSPKRPRNPQGFVSPRAERSNGARNFRSPGRVSFDIPTPRPKSHSKVHPQVNVQPPTPSNASSKFTKMAKGLAREIESERERLRDRVEEEVAPTPTRSRQKGNPLNMPLGSRLTALILLASGRKGAVKPSSRSRIYLPDVTGLTNALESPARVRLDYHRVNPADREIQSKSFPTATVFRP